MERVGAGRRVHDLRDKDLSGADGSKRSGSRRECWVGGAGHINAATRVDGDSLTDCARPAQYVASAASVPPLLNFTTKALLTWGDPDGVSGPAPGMVWGAPDVTGKFASVLPVTIALVAGIDRNAPRRVCVPSKQRRVQKSGRIGLQLVTNTAFFAPFVADRCDPETTGKSEEVVKPVTYMLPCESRAIPAMLSLPAPPR